MPGKKPLRRSASIRNVKGKRRSGNGRQKNRQRKRYRGFVLNWSNIKDSYRKPVTRIHGNSTDRTGQEVLLAVGIDAANSVEGRASRFPRHNPPNRHCRAGTPPDWGWIHHGCTHWKGAIPSVSGCRLRAHSRCLWENSWRILPRWRREWFPRPYFPALFPCTARR